MDVRAAVPVSQNLALAQRLHDGASQLLSMALLQLDMALSSSLADGRSTATHQARALAQQALNAIRHVVADLHAGRDDQDLAIVDLVSDMRLLVALLSEQSGRQIVLRMATERADDQLSALSPHARQVLLDSTRELIINACKHTAGETAVEVTLKTASTGLALSVQDQGAGFSASADSQGFGLQFLHRQLNAIGAGVCFTTAEPSGILASIDLPWA